MFSRLPAVVTQRWIRVSTRGTTSTSRERYDQDSVVFSPGLEMLDAPQIPVSRVSSSVCGLKQFEHVLSLVDVGWSPCCVRHGHLTMPLTLTRAALCSVEGLCLPASKLRPTAEADVNLADFTPEMSGLAARNRQIGKLDQKNGILIGKRLVSNLEACVRGKKSPFLERKIVGVGARL